VFEDGEFIAEKTDEVLFTKYGASGPAVIGISRSASLSLSKGRRAKIVFNFLPQYTEDQVAKIVSDFSKINNERLVELLLSGIIHKKLAYAILKLSGIEYTNIGAKELKKSEIERIVKNLTHLEIEIMGTLPISEAQVTTGGIPLAEVKPETLESVIVKGLYFAGEVLNVDGDSGGYNLQWAWSSGYVAGKSAGESLREKQ
ncbi:MAG: aminoacetone oxidase family FAD-binding enzyme, partial [Fervidobacterium sp.]